MASCSLIWGCTVQTTTPHLSLGKDEKKRFGLESKKLWFDKLSERANVDARSIYNGPEAWLWWKCGFCFFLLFRMFFNQRTKVAPDVLITTLDVFVCSSVFFVAVVLLGEGVVRELARHNLQPQFAQFLRVGAAQRGD